MQEKTHVVVLLICTTLGVNANSRPNGNKVPIKWMIFFQGDRLQMIYFTFKIQFLRIKYQHCLTISLKIFYLFDLRVKNSPFHLRISHRVWLFHVLYIVILVSWLIKRVREFALPRVSGLLNNQDAVTFRLFYHLECGLLHRLMRVLILIGVIIDDVRRRSWEIEVSRSMIRHRFAEDRRCVLRLLQENRLIEEYMSDSGRRFRNDLCLLIVEGMMDTRRYLNIFLELNSARSRRFVHQTGNSLILQGILESFVLRIQMNTVLESHMLHVVEGIFSTLRLLDLA